ncbi:MAG: cell division protein FtsI [Candidatus Pelagibacter sp.]|nr:cell division protein FtsI [Candidatus Pelagibacter sp.]|tara:strand:+ start:1142 stop:2875 length:1734 start_codon:yes stop_codon:yes gene_type:complete
MEKNKKKSNQKSFFFKDYNHYSSKSLSKVGLKISEDRVYLLFFVFFCLISIFSIKILAISLKESNFKNTQNYYNKIFKLIRSDIVDRNGIIIAKNIRVYNAAVKPNLIKDKKKFILKIKLLYPEINTLNIKNKIDKNKYFYLKKNISEDEKLKLWSLGEKGILFEKTQTRIYPHKNLFSHVLGQIDDDNIGISGLERSFDKQLRLNKKPLVISLDTNIQYLIREELVKFQKVFNNIGSASILMNIDNGEILSMVSLPDFDINKRKTIDDVNYINRATKGVYELGSVFKTFTLAGALNEGVVETNTLFKNLPKKISCAGRPIGEYDEKIPSDLTAEQILIRSGNIGSVRIAQKIGGEKMKNFLQNIGVLNKIEFDIDEVGVPISFRWGKCKLATASFGHGITTTLLQLAKGYSIISNGGFNLKPTLIKNGHKVEKKVRVLNEEVSKKINPILRKIVSTKEGTANFANIKGYEVGGKTGTAQKSFNGIYSKNKINTFVAVFPISKPKYILLVLLDEPKPSKDYIYHYKDGSGWKYKGTPYNTAGWTSVEIAGKIIEKIGPILAIKKIDFYDNYVVKKSN